MSRTETIEVITDKEKLPVDAIHQFLSEESYWAKGIPRETVQRAMENSLCFGIFYNKQFAGFARVTTDCATIAYLGDVFILPEFRGLALSKILIEQIMQHPSLQGLRRWILLTKDAHELYSKFGWTSIEDPGKWMNVHVPNIYQQNI